MKTVDIIIPTYRPDKKFLELMKRLAGQTYKISQIILINTEEKYYNQLIYGTDFLEKYKNIKVNHISKKEFDHGKTRNEGIKRSSADYFICMTMDAIPKDTMLISELVLALEQNPKAAAAYARQLPSEKCDIVEQYTRSYNYPKEGRVKTYEDLSELGIKTYFCSNVCAIYRKDIFHKLNGFCSHIIFNEDMIYAANAIKEGYSIVYAANAKVIHSHNYTCMQQFHRNFDLGVSQADHPEIFKGVPSESEGIRMIKNTALYLIEKKRWEKIPMLMIKSAYKYVGYQMGLHYRRLPKSKILKYTMNQEYWNQDGLRKAATVIDASRGYGRSEEEMQLRNTKIPEKQKE